MPSLIALSRSGRFSRTIAISPARSVVTAGTSFRAHQRDRDVEHAVGEAPLVVVPRGHLDERPTRYLRQQRIEDRARGVVIEIRRHQLLVGIFEDAFQVAAGSLL